MTSFRNLRVERLRFISGPRTGENLELNPKSITVFIGPNNGGKSRALKEISSHFSGELSETDTKVIVAELISTKLSDEEIEARLIYLSGDHPYRDQIGRRAVRITGRNEVVEVYIDDILDKIKGNKNFFEYHQSRRNFFRFFLLELGGQNRLSLLQPGQAQDLKSKPQSLAAAFLLNDDLLTKLSAICQDAFGFYLVVDPSAMNSLAFACSQLSPPPGITRSIADEALDFFRACQRIDSTSDGTRAFIGILAEVFAGSAEIIVIDEPEAFLHPSLARKLAQEIANNITKDKQVFLATHSSSFLSGLVSSGMPIDIVRFSRKSNRSSSRLLEADKIQLLMQDPLLRSANLLDALFFESCVVVEGDGDAAFYREVNDRLHVAGRDSIRHAAFITAHSKQSAHRFSKPLREIGIPTACIFDIDWLKEDGVVSQNYFRGCGVPETLIPSFVMQRQSVRRTLDAVDENYKRNGGINLLQGQELEAANEFFDRCETYGLFTVRAGELESWLSYLEVVRTKSKWVAAIFDAMGSNIKEDGYIDPEAGDVWEFIERVNSWIDNHSRKGMG